MIDVLVHFDRYGTRGGSRGCWRAWLRADRRIHDAGATPDEAFRQCVTTAISNGWETNREAYRMVE
ncbi:hypothetical protein [Tautonia plasticadhaerens]|uniref:Uncharacterized protein n=1 Tax=Tautonia plasticadhaerens TaxID=2527974 RepID=A0A518GZP3_9BACT|nr:hypothetical protein [Tautonia plasticadhaerens]QDV34049.1 hypothetical protein ElP_19300 [Tautonia plasticadhaerens]